MQAEDDKSDTYYYWELVRQMVCKMKHFRAGFYFPMMIYFEVNKFENIMCSLCGVNGDSLLNIFLLISEY